VFSQEDRRHSTRAAIVGAQGIFQQEELMWWGIGFGILYVVLLITLGVLTLRKGHWVMFIVGFFLPIFWLIGAVIPPTRAGTA
jgi:hypothetical protein